PRDLVPHTNLGLMYSVLGQYDKAVAQTEESLRLEPTIPSYGNLAAFYINLNQLDEAKRTIQQAETHKFDGLAIRSDIYYLAFLAGDTAEMNRQVGWAAGRPGEEDQMLTGHSDTQAYNGRLAQARDLSR